MFYLAIIPELEFGYIAGGLFAFLTLIELVAYGKTTLTKTDEELKVRRTAFFGTEQENYTIPLNKIRASEKVRR